MKNYPTLCLSFWYKEENHQILNRMNCLINNAIGTNLKKGRKVEVISRYIRMKYRVTIDNFSMARRMQKLKLNY
jgi:hypothetical protein